MIVSNTMYSNGVHINTVKVRLHCVSSAKIHTTIAAYICYLYVTLFHARTILKCVVSELFLYLYSNNNNNNNNNNNRHFSDYTVKVNYL